MLYFLNQVQWQTPETKFFYFSILFHTRFPFFPAFKFGHSSLTLLLAIPPLYTRYSTSFCSFYIKANLTFSSQPNSWPQSLTQTQRIIGTHSRKKFVAIKNLIHLCHWRSHPFHPAWITLCFLSMFLASFDNLSLLYLQWGIKLFNFWYYIFKWFTYS